MKQYLSWLFNTQPTFCVRSESISVIRSPSEFFASLKGLALASKSRIILSSLYLGNGPMEKELVSSVHRAMSSNPNLRVSLLLDHTRGTRGSENSITAVRSLTGTFPERFQLNLFHTPHLRSWLRWILPARWNEIVGLQHMKIYCFDNTLIISGANLSELYFTHRQDRYIRIDDCPDLCDYCQELVENVARFSFAVTTNGIESPSTCEHPVYGNLNRYIEQFRAATLNLNETWRQKLSNPETSLCDTKIAALLQMGAFDIDFEHESLQRLLNGTNISREHELNMATGYFNITDELRDSLLRSDGPNVNVILASPQANGFHHGAGLSGYIPSLYTQYARDFLAQIKTSGREHRINLYEYIRKGWTFHAKGFWLDTALGYSTLVGSTNFGYRSAERDLELQLLICTNDKRLRNDLQSECEMLKQYSLPLTETVLADVEHYVPFWVRWVSYFLRKFM